MPLPLFSLAAAVAGAEEAGFLGMIGRLALEEDESLPETVPVNSTAISEIGFDGQSVVTVTFRRGGTYAYAGSRELFEAFKLAPSKGQFFNQYLR